MRTCTECPSYVKANDDDTSLRLLDARVLGAPFCATRGIILGLPSTSSGQLEEIGQHIARDCLVFGAPVAPNLTSTEEVPVVLIPRAVKKGDGMAGLPSCNACSHFIPGSVAMDEWGLGMGVCSAKGTVVPKPTKSAVGCEFAQSGNPHESVPTDVELQPWLEEHFRVDQSVSLAAMTTRHHNVQDPSVYPTDAPVTAEQQAEGIRAWRAVKDPDGIFPDALLPIYDRSYFTELERALIPQSGDELHPELYTDYGGLLRRFAVEAQELDEACALIGQPGVGKTQLGVYLAWLMQVPFHRFSINKSTEYYDLVGVQSYDPKNGSFFKEGRFTKAYERPGVLVVDELNRGRDEIQEFFLPLTDNAKQFAVEDRLVERHEGCFMFFTLNPAWDVRHSGTEELTSAALNRLSPLWLDVPPAAVERVIIKEYCEVVDGYEIPDRILDAIVSLGEDLRAMSDADNPILPDFWGTRQQIKVARKTRWYSFEGAYRAAALDFYEPSVQDDVLRAVKSKDPTAAGRSGFKAKNMVK